MLYTQIVINLNLELFQTTAYNVLVSLSLYDGLPLFLRWLLCAMFIFHLNKKRSIPAPWNQQNQVGNAGDNSKTLPNRTLDGVAVRSVILVRYVKQQFPILRESVPKPGEAFCLDPPFPSNAGFLLLSALGFFNHSLQPKISIFDGIDTMAPALFLRKAQCVLFHIPFLQTLLFESLSRSKSVTDIPTFG